MLAVEKVTLSFLLTSIANKYDEIEQLQDTTNENCLWAVVECWFDGEGETVGQEPSWRWLIWKLDDGNLWTHLMCQAVQTTNCLFGGHVFSLWIHWMYNICSSLSFCVPNVYTSAHTVISYPVQICNSNRTHSIACMTQQRSIHQLLGSILV